ncbi:MAG: GAP family protein [Chloroflexota bacterium]|nr:MAG: GAP family protein [Chloroflexota bacterium]
MTELLVSLFSLAIAATLQPRQLIAMIILLQTRRGVANGSAYIAGMTVFRLAFGGISWVLFSNLEGSIETRGGEFSTVVGTILVILGLLMLVHALRQGFSAQGEDQAAATWLDKLEAVSPRQAFFVGLAFLALDPKDWIIDISAVNLIAEADLRGAQSFLAYLLYMLLALSLLWIPLILTLLFPVQARRGLAGLNTWMKANEKHIEITMAILFGLLFLAIGLEHLGVF